MDVIVEKKINFNNTNIYFALIKLHKGYILLISDNEKFGLGSISFSTPPLNEATKSTSSAYQLFGVEHSLLSKMIAEKASYSLKQPVVLFLFLKEREKEKELVKSIMTTLNEILNEVSQ